MSTLDGAGLSTVVNPTSLPVDTSTPQAEVTDNVIPDGAVPSAGNTSGLLANFLPAKTLLDALGLLRPSNQGDSEVLIAQAYLTNERLGDESESAAASALGSMAAAQSNLLEFFRLQLAALEASNRVDRETIATNSTTIDQLNTDIDQASEQLQEFETEQRDLNEQIAALKDIDPQTEQTAADIVALQQRLDGVNRQVTDATTALEGLRDERRQLETQNTGLQNDIDQRQSSINSQTALVSVITITLERFVNATQGVNSDVDEAQDEVVIEAAEVLLEEILPEMQRIFESDIEDAGLEETISNTSLDDREVADANIIAFGLVGTFLEALGVFLQLANLQQLDLDSTAFGNNKSQRMQISV
ncbi:hypothetical protein [Yoonia sp. BS5-3]|uniref:Uncharacterized protein n=1 Tax=Yoonia phaeophyticola TaxID=3137369 RepID=A0ABZ2V5E4_9RHOB